MNSFRKQRTLAMMTGFERYTKKTRRALAGWCLLLHRCGHSARSEDLRQPQEGHVVRFSDSCADRRVGPDSRPLAVPLVLLPVHVVFLELIIDPACSIAFEAEPEEANVMNRPPRNPQEPLFDRRTLLLSLLRVPAFC